METISHPILGTVLRIERAYVPSSRWNSRDGSRLLAGHYYLVRKPDGSQIRMTRSDWTKQVYRLAPKDVHLHRPEVVVGSHVTLRIPSGYLWDGDVVKVTRTHFTVKLREADGVTGDTIKVEEVGELVEARLCIWSCERGKIEADYRRRPAEQRTEQDNQQLHHAIDELDQKYRITTQELIQFGEW